MQPSAIAPAQVIERARLSDTVYNQLLEGIAGGKYVVGFRLPTEQQLSQQFLVSRPVVREALRRLQSDGIIVSRQGSGTYVQRRPSEKVVALTAKQNLRHVLEGFELRMSLEELSARLAARNRTDADIAAIEAAAEALSQAFARNVSRDEEKEADYAFHRAIAVASRNELLAEVLDSIAEKVKGGMQVTLSLTHEASELRRKRVLDEHERIFRAIKVGDPESAGIAMRYHLDQARNRLIDGQLDR